MKNSSKLVFTFRGQLARGEAYQSRLSGFLYQSAFLYFIYVFTGGYDQMTT